MGFYHVNKWAFIKALDRYNAYDKIVLILNSSASILTNIATPSIPTPGTRSRCKLAPDSFYRRIPLAFPNSTVYQNLMMQALNLNVKNPKEEISRVLKLVSMSGAANRKFKECSLGMKQRLGVAQSLLGHPQMLILDEPINGLDADGMRIVRETLIELNRHEGVTILISSHILGELAKVATHYGIIRNGALIREMPAGELSDECRDFVLVKTSNDAGAIGALHAKYPNVERLDSGIRVYGEEESSAVSGFLYEHGFAVSEIALCKIGLEEYYLRVMSKTA